MENTPPPNDVFPKSSTLGQEETPYAVICPDDGQVFLTEEQYIAQMKRPNQRWMCPLCGELASFDDENFEKYLEEIPDDVDVT